MGFNGTLPKTSSGGAWQGDNPLQFAFPLLIIQFTVVILISRVLAFLLKPLRQPKVVAEILGGILLGPSALGRDENFIRWVFPAWSNPILESVASMGLLFYLFLVGLELDLNSLRRSGKKAFGIAAASIILPFLFSIGLTFLLSKVLKGDTNRGGYGQFLLFMGVSLSITAFPVLARILVELRLLTTEVGQTAMAAAAFNDVAAWILLALAVALAGGAHKSPLISLWVLLSGVVFVAFMLIFVRRIMNWVARQSSSAHTINIDEAYICLTLAAVMVSGFMTDLIGIHAIFGAFIFGLAIPKDGEFAGKLIKGIEDFVSGLLLPLYFASSGLKTNVTKIHGLESWGLLVLIISVACAGKILGTFMAAKLCMIPAREAVTLGLLMNTKGLVELIVLNIGKEKKVLDDEMFAILVIMALFTTFMTTPIVMAIYRPARKFSSRAQPEESSASRKSEEKLRILMCTRGPGDSPSLINLIELCRSTKISSMKLYMMQLLEITDRSSSILMVQRVRRNGVSCMGSFCQGELSDQVGAAFKAYSQLGKVTVRPTTSISALSTMHEDICHVAEKKRAAMIILPFHKAWKRDGNGEIEMNLGNGWRRVNQMVLMNAPCTVAMLVDRGFRVALKQSLEDNVLIKKVCILFLGGPDSRKALELGCLMAEHPAVRVTVVRFTMFTDMEDTLEARPSLSPVFISKDHHISITPKSYSWEQELDNTILGDFRRKWNGEVEYVEKVTGNLVNEVQAMAQGEFELVIAGKGKFSPAVTAELVNCRPEFEELGHIGDLISSGKGMKCSVLVIQQHDSIQEDKIPNSGEMANCNTVDKCVESP